MTSSAALALLLLVVLAAQRLLELRASRRNERALLAAGGRRVPRDGHAALVAVHAAFFPAFAAEVLLAPWAGPHAFTSLLLGVAGAAEALRQWAIRTLGPRWTTRVVVLPGAPRVASGPYRFLRHPNYVAVSLLLLALPLAFGAVATAIGASVANGVALAWRLPREERALREAGDLPGSPRARAPG